MNRLERERIETIVCLWVSYEDKQIEQAGIMGEGPGLSEARIPSTKDKPDIMAKKAELLSKCRFTAEEIQAYDMIFSMPVYAREYITLWPQIKNKINPKTRQRFSQSEAAAILGRSLEDFRAIRNQAMSLLIMIDRRLNSHLYRKAA